MAWSFPMKKRTAKTNRGLHLHGFSLLILLALVPGARLRAQEKFSLDGYLSDMQSVYHLPPAWLWGNSLHTRLNLQYIPSDWFSASLQARSRILTGKVFTSFPGYAEALDGDPGAIDMSLVSNGPLGANAGYALTSQIDRLWLRFSFGALEITAGRQRINWGQTFVWNPNDIFNAYSYFEVDYPEHPGSDAIRLQYYTGSASTIELAAKVDSAGDMTAAGYYRFNAAGYDIQLFGGLYRSKDLVLGTGWSGSLGPTAFRGEMSYFRDLDHFADTSGCLMVSAGLDYRFSFSLYLQLEVLRSGFAKDMHVFSIMQLYGANMDVKSLGFTPWTFFCSLSYPLTPLLNSGFAAIYYPRWKGVFLGPSFDLSLNNNLDLSLVTQYFSAAFDFPGTTSQRENNLFAFLRLKWSF